MRTIKGPGVFLAQFAGDEAPFNTLKGLAGWAADKGFKGVQIPTWDRRVFDLERAADSQDYVDEIKGTLGEHGLVVTDLASHLQGQLVALHPSFNLPADSFAPAKVHCDPTARQEWAVNQLLCAARASRRFGLNRHTTFSGARSLWTVMKSTMADGCRCGSLRARTGRSRPQQQRAGTREETENGTV